MNYPLQDCDVSQTSRVRISQLLNEAPELYHYGGTRIVQISRTVVVKYGTAVSICEARNMELVIRQTTIRLPQTLDSWIDKPKNEEEDRVAYIVMAFVAGSLLYELWPKLDLKVRDDIHQQIFKMLEQLQKIEMLKPGPVGGGVSRGDLFTEYGAGLFSSCEDMEEWFNERLLVSQQFGRADPNQTSFTGQFSRLVMCHMDLHMRNIIIDKESKVWLIDWASAGGYPPWFEQAAIARLCDNPSFVDGLLNKVANEKYVDAINNLDAVGFGLTTGALCQPWAAMGTGYTVKGSRRSPHDDQ